MEPHFWDNFIKNKTGVINDSLGQTHSLASFHLKFVLFLKVRTDERTICAKTMITTGRGRDCGSASWINCN